MQNGIEFFTATCLKWKPLLQPDEHKDIIMNSLKFLVEDKRIWLYGFVIMPNHIHLMWCKQDAWLEKNVQQMFLKFTAQQIKFRLIEDNPKELDNYISTQNDRDYHLWLVGDNTDQGQWVSHALCGSFMSIGGVVLGLL